MKRTTKILLVSNYKQGIGGISGQVEILKNKLAAEGCDVSIFNTKGSVLYRLIAYFRLCFVGKKYDVFHIHGCSGWGFLPVVYGVSVGKFLSKRIVVTYHGGGANGFFNKYSRLIKHYLLKTDVNIVLSGFLGNVFEKFGIPYEIIPNIIELDNAKYCERKFITPNFISLRTLSPLYNIECTLRAFIMVKKNIPNATLTIVGDGPSRTDLEKNVLDNAIQDVHFTGRVPNHEIYKYLGNADIMLSAPRIDNMPVSLLEGFNAGLLVISSNVGGVPYMIEDGKNGLLFESDNDKELAEKMIWAVENQTLSLQLISNARQDIQKYSWQNIKPRILNLYVKN